MAIVRPVKLSLNWASPAWGSGGRTFSAMPEVDEVMYREPGRYKLRVDFHRYYTFEFFRRINEQASRNMNELGTPGRISCYPFVQHFSGTRRFRRWKSGERRMRNEE